IGSVEDGHWVRYQGVDFGDRTESVEIRAASATGGGTIELRDGAPEGALLGTCVVTDTGDWQAWDSFQAQIKPSSGVKTLCLRFKSNHRAASLWYGGVDKEKTVIHAQFPGVNPNEAKIEINVRQTVFYPEKPSVSYLTVRGFILENAAPNWAPPNAEQKAIIGTHWSRGWIIENNTVRYSRCAGVSLGKYGDAWDNKSETAEGYLQTITRALTNGWNKETVGSHVVRKNHIHHCEQAGIVGSMGCAFSTVSGNEIHDIYVHRQYSGAETAGIKFHGAVDMTISNNHIYRCGIFGGLWLDWMAQGTQVSGNLFHDNNGSNLGAEYSNQDILLEVNHGPLLFANNLLLSQHSLWAISQGCAYVHNLFAGTFRGNRPGEESRVTPALKAHSTEMDGLHPNPVGDVRFLNNLFARRGDASLYDKPTLPVGMAGNVFLKGAKPSKQEAAPLLKPDFDPGLTLLEKPDGWHLELTLDQAWRTEQARKPVTSAMLGKAKIPDLPYENPNGTAIRITTDYFGK
ncbi:MAG: carbohydrate-binding protein, partial [Verrucomicrobia bacterium]|nr:carbohydrate-binding protein [Verrucomicrobiota bacterium]